MDSDLFLVIGVIVGVFAIPSIVSAIVWRRSPSGAAVMVMIAGGMIAIAIMNGPEGFSLKDLPEAFTRVFARYLS